MIKKVLLLSIVSFISLSCFSFTVVNASQMFADDFSSSSSSWTPASSAWVLEDGQYKHKETGSFFTQNSKTLFSDDFAVADPVLSTSSIPLDDSFTQADGADSNFTVKRGSFAVSSNVYVSSNGTYTLSVANAAGATNWTNYRFMSKVKREGASDVYGYSMIYFRLNMVDATNDNSYVLIIRQTGLMELNKKASGTLTSLATATVVKDNNFHDVIILAVGSTIKVWFDKTENQVPDIAIVDTTYSAGTIGLGTNSWVSDFDDVKVALVSTSTSLRWTERRGGFYVTNNQFTAINKAATGVSSLAVVADSNSSVWRNYDIRTRFSHDASTYADFYVRVTPLTATTETGYVVRFNYNGYGYLYRLDNSWTTSMLIDVFRAPFDTNWHDLRIQVFDQTIRIWYDNSDSYFPTYEYRGLSEYTSGMIGWGSNSGKAYISSYQVYDYISLESSPSHLYTNSENTSTILLENSSNLDNTILSITNPFGTVWSLENPSNCTGSKTCSFVFPTDFSGANLNILGTYAIVASSTDQKTTLLIEIREKPVYTFYDMSDIHYEAGTSATNTIKSVLDINNNHDFPRPNFVVSTGDNTNSGTTLELPNFKSITDTLLSTYHAVIAGHDTNSELAGDKGHIWSDVFGADSFSYSWTLGDYLFLAMDEQADYYNYGTTLNTVWHKAWLQSILDANPDKYVFLFNHFSLDKPRVGIIDSYWEGPTNAPVIRQILEDHGKVIMQFAGHTHLFNLSSINGIFYAIQGSFYNENSYSMIEIFNNRIKSTIVKKNAYHGDNSTPVWTSSSDATHSTTLYNFGLPHERQYNINYISKTKTIADGISYAGNNLWKDYEYQTDVTMGHEGLVGENVAGVAFRYTDKDNYYSVLLDSGLDTLSLERMVDGAPSVLASTSIALSLNTKYTLRVRLVGNSIKVYLDDVLKIDTTDSNFTLGKIGFRTYLASTTYDNVSVTNLTLPTLSTPSISNISASLITLNGNISDLGGDTSTVRGFEYGTTTAYGTLVSSDGSYNTGSFAENMTNFSCNTNYHTRAFTTNSAGTASSSDVSFVTLACVPTNLSASINSNSVSLSVDRIPDDTTGSSGYYFSRTGSNSGWIQVNSWTDTNISCGSTYTYSVKYRNQDAIETNPVSISVTTANCPSVGSGSSVQSRVFNLISLGLYKQAEQVAKQHNMLVPSSTQKPSTIPSLLVLQTPTNITPLTFYRILKQGMIGNDVKQLQIFLNKQGFIISKIGPGSPGKETTVFGPATKVALMKFQQYYRKEILESQGLNNPTGIVGEKTMEIIRQKKAL